MRKQSGNGDETVVRQPGRQTDRRTDGREKIRTRAGSDGDEDEDRDGHRDKDTQRHRSGDGDGRERQMESETGTETETESGHGSVLPLRKFSNTGFRFLSPPGTCTRLWHYTFVCGFSAPGGVSVRFDAEAVTGRGSIAVVAVAVQWQQ